MNTLKQAEILYKKFISSKNLKERAGQLEMLKQLIQSIESQNYTQAAAQDTIFNYGQTIIEAGTGTGKTLAYLIAAFVIAKKYDKKVIISTATIALQEQLIHKDIPDLINNTGIEFNYTLAKGRARYVCLAKIKSINDGQAELFFNDIPSDEKLSQLKTLNTIFENKQWDGDRDTLPHYVSAQVWHSAVTTSHACFGRRCEYYKDCVYYKARDTLQQADIIVANHDLTLIDFVSGNMLYPSAPKDNIYIFDEAHHLIEKSVKHFSYIFSVEHCAKILEDTQKILLYAINNLRNLNISKSAQISYANSDFANINLALQTCKSIAEKYKSNNKVYSFYRFQFGVITAELQIEFDTLFRFIELLNKDLKSTVNITDKELKAGDNNPYDTNTINADDQSIGVNTLIAKFFMNISLISGEISDFLASIAEFIKVDTGLIKARWLEFNNDQLLLHTAPLVSFEYMQEYIFNKAWHVACVSATLSINQDFTNYVNKLGFKHNTPKCAIPSPFDYHNKAILRLYTNNIDITQEHIHTDEIIRLLPLLIKRTHGGVFVYFSSKRQMQSVYEQLVNVHSIILKQDSMSKAHIIKHHKERIELGKQSIIFGLAAFAEGMDLPGDYCNLVIICKIPFATPDNPHAMSLKEFLESKNFNYFTEEVLPNATIRLIQATGRLIRTENDTGEIVILDSRLVCKSYGKYMLNALPDFNIQDLDL